LVKPVRIALLDTGIDPAHPEFDAGQIVGWWDFTLEGLPAGASADPFDHPPSQRAWDPYRAPNDGFGHGTATASLAAGENRGRCGPGPVGDKLSFAPGAQLLVAKVYHHDASVDGATPGPFATEVSRAMRWAIEQGADVISMSIGVTPGAPRFNAEDFQYAKDHGVIVVVAAGNGEGYPSEASNYGGQPDALVVGSAFRDGAQHGILGTPVPLWSGVGYNDPDVVSLAEDVCAAYPGGTYLGNNIGTSFAAPLVAGMAAKAIEIARANGAPSDREHVVSLLLAAATNRPDVPYAKEGLGFLLDREWPTIAHDAATGEIPDYAAQGAHARTDLALHAAKKDAEGQTPTVPGPAYGLP
jgi:Subtilase family